MRHKALLAFLAFAAAGCASSPSTNTGAGTGAAATPAAASASAGGENPCAGASCQVVVEVEAGALANEFTRRQANYKVYQGCPRSLGVSNAAGLRGIAPAAQSTRPTISVPGTLQGRYATVALFFGAEPQRYVVVDFGANRTGTVNFGYLWESGSLGTDQTKVNTNNSFMTRTCR